MKTFLLSSILSIMLAGTLQAQKANIKWLGDQTLGSEVIDMTQVISTHIYLDQMMKRYGAKKLKTGWLLPEED